MPIAAQTGGREFDEAAAERAKRYFEEGKDTFRFDTFGSEDFWGGQLKLHMALMAEKLSGVGPGVSPEQALVDDAYAPGIGHRLDGLELAHELKQPAAIVQAVSAKAKLFGLEAPTKSVNVNLSATYAQMTDAELHYELVSLLNEVRAAAGKPIVVLPPPPKDHRYG